MTPLANFARYEAIVLLAAFAGVIIYQFLTGAITLRGVLCEKTNAGVDGISAARVQLLLSTLAMAFYVLSQIIRTHAFPEIDTKWLLLLGGSNSIFLSAKGVLSLLSSEPR